MNEEKTPETDKLIKRITRMVNRAGFYSLSDRVDKVYDLIKQAERLMEKFQGNMPSELEETHCMILVIRGGLLENQGYLTHGFKVVNELLSIAEKYDNKWGLSEGHYTLANLYRRSNDLDKAFEHYDRSIMLKEELLNESNEIFLIARVFTSAIEATVIKNDVERARKYFTRLEELHELKIRDSLVGQAWKIGKIFLLSASTRPRDWVKAEDLCEELIQDESTTIQYKVVSRQILCKLLFFELRVTNDTGIINEIKALFPKIIELIQQYGSMAYLVDFYVIQGKLALLTFDFKTARRSFTQARRIAERHGYHLGAVEITRLEEEVKQQLTTWEHLKEKNAPFSERMELARVNEHFNQEFQAHMIKKEQIAEEEVTVYKDLQSCIVCKGGAEGFNIYVCPSCKSIYCKKCAQAVIDIENACWTCESPIDVTRPSKPFEQAEKKKIEIKVNKKSVEKG